MISLSFQATQKETWELEAISIMKVKKSLCAIPNHLRVWKRQNTRMWTERGYVLGKLRLEAVQVQEKWYRQQKDLAVVTSKIKRKKGPIKKVYIAPLLRLESEALSTPFWCLCQKLYLSLFHFNKTMLHKHQKKKKKERKKEGKSPSFGEHSAI